MRTSYILFDLGPLLDTALPDVLFASQNARHEMLISENLLCGFQFLLDFEKRNKISNLSLPF